MSIKFRNRKACRCLATWLPAYEAELLRRGVIKHNIDIFQLIGSNPKSAGTHKSGGAFDIAQTTDEAIEVARLMGADATWLRPLNWDGKGGIEHTHGVLRGCRHNAPARYQVTAVDAGFNGLGHLGQGGPDTGPRPLSKRTWKEGIAWARTQRPAELVVVAWNVFVGNDPDRIAAALTELAEEHQPDVFVLTEATRCHRQVAKAADALGYRVFHEQPTPGVHGGIVHEEGDTAVLVRSGADVKVLAEHVASMGRNWIGPKHGLKHEPRRYRRLRLQVRGTRWGLTGSHWPTGGPGGANKTAFRETMRRSRAWALAAPVRATVDVGDLNGRIPALTPWAKRFGATVTGHGVDVAVHRGCSAEATVLEAFGSDHRAMLFRFTKGGS